MRMNIDVKTLIIGFLLGVVLTMVIGATTGGASKADFGIAIEDNGSAIVRSDDGTLYVVNPDSAKAEYVESRSGPYKGMALNLARPSSPTNDSRRERR